MPLEFIASSSTIKRDYVYQADGDSAEMALKLLPE